MWGAIIGLIGSLIGSGVQVYGADQQKQAVGAANNLTTEQYNSEQRFNRGMAGRQQNMAEQGQAFNQGQELKKDYHSQVDKINQMLSTNVALKNNLRDIWAGR